MPSFTFDTMLLIVILILVALGLFWRPWYHG